MIEIQRYTVPEVKEAWAHNRFFLNGERQKRSDRFKLFFAKGCTCTKCGLEGNVIILETHDPSIRPHLNLYHENDNGELTLFTKDHIFPKSKGGANTMDNYQTMCAPCNEAKADILE